MYAKNSAARPQVVILEKKSIPVGDLRADLPTREKLGHTDSLQYSIRNNDLREPLLVHPETLQIVSGFRRYAAMRQLRRLSVPVVFPANAAEACQSVRDHLEMGNQRQQAMTVREKFALSQRLREFSRPEYAAAWRHEDYAGPAVGLTSAILRALRAAERGFSAPEATGSSAENARRVFLLMLEALEGPAGQGCSPGQTVRRLTGYLRSGDCPNTLAEACEVSTAKPSVPAQGGGGAGQAPVSPARRRTQNEIRRGIDTISGACAGLASVCVTDLPSDDIPYLAREIRKNRRILGDVLKSLQENCRD
ncbi:ParB/Srx family N-terminal domain-containing protein [Streptomyces bauhiniae]|uniref:ParB/Srx family N-terminal domain-containing protein n=1 Tax=Streptomyces bauhiniae TaxID=2340725 RepID=UPI0035D9A170